MFAKWWKFTSKKHLVTSLIFSFKISKKKRFIIILKITSKFSNKFDVEIVYGFKVGVIRFLKNFFSIKIFFFPQMYDLKFLEKIFFFISS